MQMPNDELTQWQTQEQDLLYRPNQTRDRSQELVDRARMRRGQ